MLISGFNRFTMTGVHFPEISGFPVPLGVLMILTSYFVWKGRQWSYVLAVIMTLTVPLSMWYSVQMLSSWHSYHLLRIVLDEFAVWVCLCTALMLLSPHKQAVLQDGIEH